MFNSQFVHNHKSTRIIILSLFFSGLTFFSALAQTEVMAWGNLTGIRVEGQLMEFETSLRVVGKGWNIISATGKERQSRPRYHRDGITQTVSTDSGGFQFTEIVKENGSGSAIVSVTAKAAKDTIIDGLYFCINLPEEYYENGTLRLNGSGKKQPLSGLVSTAEKIRKLSAKSIIAESDQRQLSVSLDAVSSLIIRKEKNTNGYLLYIGLTGTSIKKDQQVQRNFTIKATGVIDKTPVEIVVDAQNPGQRFDGFSGNFRLQNPKADPQVIQYCLDNMRVAWGRVEMPWSMWHPDENIDPIESVRSGKLNQHVQESMLMAQKLAKIGMPIIISDWSAPNWAILGDPRDAFRNRSRGIRGFPLNPEKTEKIYKSIADYLTYLKQNYGVEPDLFSFMEGMRR